jgi:hypothetical protein
MSLAPRPHGQPVLLYMVPPYIGYPADVGFLHQTGSTCLPPDWRLIVRLPGTETSNAGFIPYPTENTASMG